MYKKKDSPKQKKQHQEFDTHDYQSEKNLFLAEDVLVQYESAVIPGARILKEVPSYDLDGFRITGEAFKTIIEHLKDLGIRMEDVFDSSVASIYRQFKKADIDLEFKDQLAAILKLADKGISAFGEADLFKNWLQSEVENLAGHKPIHLIRLESGRREVERLLDQIEYGIYG